MSQLRFEKIELLCGVLGPESTVPDISSHINVQNRLQFDLDEYDEIYEGYGQLPNAYPYRQQDSYSRELSKRQTEAAILENDLMTAVFLPEYGGRLWKLWDKKHGRDLIYSNDCLRASNLAVRNAWFSGGVEWNCGVIGHSPFTMDRIFAAGLSQDGRDILRLYNYERIRGAVYQMDFWLDDQSPALNCHMSICNPTDQVVPMYWWTNIASPLYPDGRLLVPAHQAYSYDRGTIVKVPVPVPAQGQSVEKYITIPNSRDFFFLLDSDAPRWIANTDSMGRGMIHLSSQRLISRKLFVWGQNAGSRHWQEYLTKGAGDYIELQAGLGKTQYGCLPMAPHTVWEWTERFEALQLTEQQNQLPFREAVASLNRQIGLAAEVRNAESFGIRIRKQPSHVFFRGTGDAALQNALRQKQGLSPMVPYLDFASDDRRQKLWYQLLKTGVLPEPPVGTYPAYDPSGPEWLRLLEDSLDRGENWYSLYCIALLQLQAGRLDLSEKAIRKSLKLKVTAVGNYVYASLLSSRGDTKKAATLIRTALGLSGNQYSFIKASIQLLVESGAWSKTLSLMHSLPEAYQADPRIRLCCVRCLYELGHYRAALSLLEKDGGIRMDDIREGEMAMGELWVKLQRATGHSCQEVPYAFQFDALGAGYES